MTSGNKNEIYNFSKIIIKQLITAEEWGISPFVEKSFTSSNNVTIKYNYWDYIQAFDNVFFCQNDKKKHTWMIKVCDRVYNSEIPNWFKKWWNKFGPLKDILPDIMIEDFKNYRNVSPK